MLCHGALGIFLTTPLSYAAVGFSWGQEEQLLCYGTLATSERSRFKEGWCENEHDDRCTEASDTLKREPTPCLGPLSKIFLYYLSDCCWNGISMMGDLDEDIRPLFVISSK
jgi:hypothetical protein